MFCVISHIPGLTYYNQVFRFSNATLYIILTLRVRFSLNYQSISWRNEMLDVPIFRLLNFSDQGKNNQFNEPLLYSQYQKWVKRLEEEIGFVQVLITYCLRRAAGNSINDESHEL